MTPAAKYAPAVVPLISGAIAAYSDILIQAGAVIGGLALGAMWRAGSLRSDGQSWANVRSDLGISALIGGANAVLALVLVDLFNANLLFAMGVGVLVGATGLRALPEIKSALVGHMRRQILGDDVALIQPRDADMMEKLTDLDETFEAKPPPPAPPKELPPPD